jgi:hypothetical protein
MALRELPAYASRDLPKKIEDIRFYDIQANWRRLRDLFYSKYNLYDLYIRMESFEKLRKEEYGYEYKPREFTLDLRPVFYDYYSWRSRRNKRGRMPAFWDFACQSACHWVNAWAMECICSEMYTEFRWRLVTSDKHTTIWDGDKTLFDINFLALGISPEEAWELAACQPDSEVWTEFLAPDADIPDEILPIEEFFPEIYST